MIAAAGAKNGASWPTTAVATIQASVAATVDSTIGTQFERNRRAAAPRRDMPAL